jgi:methyl-accepting chemotaxis protein
VAEEIRKMATNSAESVKNIKTILENIHKQTETVVATIAAAAQTGERQAAATEQISATMQQLASTSSDVERVAASI